MDRRSMVAVLRVRDAFHARVVAARLGSEGIVAQVRGGDGPYPTGIVEVLVPAEELPAAQELLLADEIEAAFADDGDEPLDGTRRSRSVVVVVLTVSVLVLLAASVVTGYR